MEALTQRAQLLRESLQKSQAIADGVVAILGSFDHRLSALDAAMRPTQVRTHAIRTAHENIDRTLRAADVILAQFDRIRELGPVSGGWRDGGSAYELDLIEEVSAAFSLESFNSFSVQ